MTNTKEVRGNLKKAYRRQNEAYAQWKKKLVGTVPEVLRSPELLNSELVHSLVESVDWLLAQRERDEKTRTLLANQMVAVAEKLDAFEQKLGGD